MQAQALVSIPIFDDSLYSDSELNIKIKMCLDQQKLGALLGWIKIKQIKGLEDLNWKHIIIQCFRFLISQKSAMQAQKKKKIIWPIIQIWLRSCIEGYTWDELSLIDQQIRVLLEGLRGLFIDRLRQCIPIPTKSYTKSKEVDQEDFHAILRTIVVFISMLDSQGFKAEIDKNLERRMICGLYLQIFLKRIPDLFQMFNRIRYELLEQEYDLGGLISQKLNKIQFGFVNKKLIVYLDWIGLYVHSSYMAKYFMKSSSYINKVELNQKLKQKLNFIIFYIMENYLQKINDDKDNTEKIYVMVQWNLIPTILLLLQIKSLNHIYIKQKVLQLIQIILSKIPQQMWLEIGEQINPQITNFITLLLTIKYFLASSKQNFSIKDITEYKYLPESIIRKKVQNKQSKLSSLEICLYMESISQQNPHQFKQNILKVWSQQQIVNIIKNCIDTIFLQEPWILFFGLLTSVQIICKAYQTPENFFSQEKCLQNYVNASTLILLLTATQNSPKKLCIFCNCVSQIYCINCRSVCRSFVWACKDYTLAIQQQKKIVHKQTYEFQSNQRFKLVPQPIRQQFQLAFLTVKYEIDL